MLRPYEIDIIGCLSLEWVKSWVSTRPHAARSAIQVAAGPMAAAVRQDAPRLVGQELSRVDYLRLQADFFLYMLAILHFQGFPNLLTHIHAPFAILVYPELNRCQGVN